MFPKLSATSMRSAAPNPRSPATGPFTCRPHPYTEQVCDTLAGLRPGAAAGVVHAHAGEAFRELADVTELLQDRRLVGFAGRLLVGCLHCRAPVARATRGVRNQRSR